MMLVSMTSIECLVCVDICYLLVYKEILKVSLLEMHFEQSVCTCIGLLHLECTWLLCTYRHIDIMFEHCSRMGHYV
jgi:hypothetical protein